MPRRRQLHLWVIFLFTLFEVHILNSCLCFFFPDGHSCPKGLSCRKPDCAFGADVNAEIIDLHGFAAPIALRELVYPSQSNAPSQSHPHPHSHSSHRVSPSPLMTTSMHATTSSDYYQVYPRLPVLPASPFYEVMW